MIPSFCMRIYIKLFAKVSATFSGGRNFEPLRPLFVLSLVSSKRAPKRGARTAEIFRCQCQRGAVRVGLTALALALLAVGLLCGDKLRTLRGDAQEVQGLSEVFEFSMPKGAGVNLGGWFVLEDWFFSGSHGKLVSSETQGQGRCLPPLLHHVDEAWPSEGVLLRSRACKLYEFVSGLLFIPWTSFRHGVGSGHPRLASRLNASFGSQETARIFKAHREEFFTKDELQEIIRSGIDTIRLPITWAAFADALAPLSQSVYAAHNPDTEAQQILAGGCSSKAARC